MCLATDDLGHRNVAAVARSVRSGATGIAEFPSSSHALFFAHFRYHGNSEVGSIPIYETSSSEQVGVRFQPYDKTPLTFTSKPTYVLVRVVVINKEGKAVSGPSSCCLLHVRPDGSVEQCGEGMPGGGHSDGDGQCDGREDQWCGPQRGAVDAAESDEFVDNQKENQHAEAGDGPSRRRESDASPGKATEGGCDEAHGGYQDEAFVCVWSASSTPGGVDDYRKSDDADQGNSSGHGGVERADLHSPMERIDGSDYA